MKRLSKNVSTGSVMWSQHEELNIWPFRSFGHHFNLPRKKEIEATFPEMSYLSTVINFSESEGPICTYFKQQRLRKWAIASPT